MSWINKITFATVDYYPTVQQCWLIFVLLTAIINDVSMISIYSTYSTYTVSVEEVYVDSIRFSRLKSCKNWQRTCHAVIASAIVCSSREQESSKFQNYIRTWYTCTTALIGSHRVIGDDTLMTNWSRWCHLLLQVVH